MPTNYRARALALRRQAKIWRNHARLLKDVIHTQKEITSNLLDERQGLRREVGLLRLMLYTIGVVTIVLFLVRL